MKRKSTNILFILIALYVIFKGVTYIKYGLDQSEDENNVKISGTVTINKTTLDDSEYYEYKNVKFKNVFDGYTKVEDGLDDHGIRFYIRNENDQIEKGILIGIDKQYVDLILNSDDVDNKAYIKKIFKKNKINNDIDLIEYYDTHDYEKVKLFMFYNNQRKTYDMNLIREIMFPSINGIKIINGDEEGYILELTSNGREVNIINNNKKYYFTFLNDFTDEFINEFISTIEIN